MLKIGDILDVKSSDWTLGSPLVVVGIKKRPLVYTLKPLFHDSFHFSGLALRSIKYRVRGHMDWFPKEWSVVATEAIESLELKAFAKALPDLLPRWDMLYNLFRRKHAQVHEREKGV